MGLFISLLVLSFLIFFHELGHFLAARFFGVHVEVFSIGFGKKLYVKEYGDTQYALSAIPLGGYVRMKGQDDANPAHRSEEPDSYNTKPPYARLIILFAGPFANLFLAFLLYFFVALVGSQQLAPIIAEPEATMVAAKAGLKANDEITHINGKPMHSWSEVREYIKDSEGELEFVILRANRELVFHITPQIRESENIFGETILRPMIGIRPNGETREVAYSLLDSLPKALGDTAESSKMIILSIQKLLSGIVPASEVGGIVSIMQITSKASESGIITLALFTALISVNLGILNLLPIPALDGGHIIFTLYEMLARRAPSVKVLTNLTISGWVLLVSLMILGLYNDLSRIAQGGILP